jgi:hypothetical protein
MLISLILAIVHLVQTQCISYRGNCQEHDNKLLLIENWVPNKCIRESAKTPSPLLDEGAVRCQMIAVDYILLADDIIKQYRQRYLLSDSLSSVPKLQKDGFKILKEVNSYLRLS